jgi:lantibiotic leader peptide-processing serine protease
MSKRSIRLAAGFGLVAASIVAAAVLSTTARAGADSTYLLVYRGSAVPADAPASIQQAGGTLVWSYSQIGVAIAKSSDASFSETLLKDNRVESAAATSRFGTQLDTVESSGGSNDPLPDATPAPGSYDLSSLQWDMNQIQAPEARAINGGSPSVVVADIDTGFDYTHPDLAPNVDFANSVSCVGGVPNQAPSA